MALCCKEHGLNAAHVSVDYSGKDLNKLSMFGQLLHTVLQLFPGGGASENQL